MPARRGITDRRYGEAGGSDKPAIQKGLDIVTPYAEAGKRLVKYFTYGLPDNNRFHKPQRPDKPNNQERLDEEFRGLRPNLFRWSPQYQKWVETYGPLALSIEPVTGEYKGQEVREQEVKLAIPETELPPEILSQLLGLQQEEIEGITLEQLLPSMPKPADLDLIKRNSIPSLDPYIVALGTDAKQRVPYLYVVSAGEKKGVVKAPASEYSFRGIGASPVDPADIALVFNNVVPAKDFISGLLDPRNDDKEGTISAEGFRKLLEEFELEPKDLADAAEKLRSTYDDGWKLDYKS